MSKNSAQDGKIAHDAWWCGGEWALIITQSRAFLYLRFLETRAEHEKQENWGCKFLMNIYVFYLWNRKRLKMSVDVTHLVLLSESVCRKETNITWIDNAVPTSPRSLCNEFLMRFKWQTRARDSMKMHSNSRRRLRKIAFLMCHSDEPSRGIFLQLIYIHNKSKDVSIKRQPSQIVGWRVFTRLFFLLSFEGEIAGARTSCCVEGEIMTS